MNVTAYFKMASSDRTEIASAFVGHRVVLTVDRFRDSRHLCEVSGTLVAAARLDHGTTHDVVVIQLDGTTRTYAFPGAIVRQIRRA